VSLAVLVPNEGIARVIGKAGAGLKQIRESSGAKVRVQQDAGVDPNAPRRVDLAGPAFANVAQAVAGVLRQISPEPTDAAVLIPAKLAGTVIGKGGANLRTVQETFNVRLSVEREPMCNPESGEEERMLFVFGEPAAVGHALASALSGGLVSGRPAAQFAPMAADRNVPMMANRNIVGGSRLMAPAAGMAQAGMVSAGLAAAEVQPMPAGDPEAIQVHLSIADRAVGAVVGKAGGTIKELKAQTGCYQLAMSKRNPAIRSRYLICIGHLPQVQEAQHKVHSIAQAALAEQGELDPKSINVEAIFWVPTEASGGVIGKAGGNLGRIREEAGVKLTFGKEVVQGRRPCTLSGPFPNVLHGETLIFGTMAAQPSASDGSRKRPAPEGWA